MNTVVALYGREGFDALVEHVCQTSVNRSGMEHGVVLCETAILPNELFEMYLKSFGPKHVAEHTCSYCRDFFNRFAHVVAVDEEGNARSLLWSEVNAPAGYKKIVEKLRIRVEAAPITAYFQSHDIPDDGLVLDGVSDFRHFQLKLHPFRYDNATAQTQDFHALSYTLARTSLEALMAVQWFQLEVKDCRGNHHTDRILDTLLALKLSLSDGKHHARAAGILWHHASKEPRALAYVAGTPLGALIAHYQENPKLTLQEARTFYLERQASVDSGDVE